QRRRAGAPERSAGPANAQSRRHRGRRRGAAPPEPVPEPETREAVADGRHPRRGRGAKEGAPRHPNRRAQLTISLVSLSSKVVWPEARLAKNQSSSLPPGSGVPAGWPLAVLLLPLSCTVVPHTSLSVWPLASTTPVRRSAMRWL